MKQPAKPSVAENQNTVTLNRDIRFHNAKPMVLIGGTNAIESESIVMQTAETFMEATTALKMPYVFKASFDKANRSSLSSFRGLGKEEGLRILQKVKDTFGCPIITDIHTADQAKSVSEVADILQIPAFLARQTDLLEAAAKTGRLLNVKKPQFVAPHDMGNIVKKCQAFGNEKVLLCERGTMFGYNNMVVDMLGMLDMKDLGQPVMFDVTHSLQKPGGLGHATAGRGHQVCELARSGISLGIASLFLEAHPNPAEAKCDGPCALPNSEIHSFLAQMQELDAWVKGL